MSYINKYQKYIKKNQLGGRDPTIANVLVIIDVQNCFIAGGSLGGDEKNKSLIYEIHQLVNSGLFDYIVITRDVHPAHHRSHMITTKPGMVAVVSKDKRTEVPEGYAQGITLGIVKDENIVQVLGGMWVPHCRANPAHFEHIGSCSNRNITDASGAVIGTEADVWTGTKKEGIIGVDIAHSYNDYIAASPIFQKFKNPDMKLGLLDVAGEHTKNPDTARYKFEMNPKPIKNTKEFPPVLEVLKGQLCDWDSYSAFQYHSNYGAASYGPPVVGSLPYTTGLAEVLFSNEAGIRKFKPSATKVNIVSCGLVGEVCVSNTVAYGVNLMNAAFRSSGLVGYDRIVGQKLTPAPLIKTNFVYSIMGTRYLPNPGFIKGIPALVKKGEDDAGGANPQVTYCLDLIDPRMINGTGTDTNPYTINTAIVSPGGTPLTNNKIVNLIPLLK